MFKSLFLPLIGVAAFIVVVGLLSQGKLGFLSKKNLPPASTSPLSPEIKIEGMTVKVEVAKTDSERAKGLSNRETLEEKSGMVFIFNENSKPVFWMKDTKIPLDIIWINDNKITGIERNVQPEPGKNDNDLRRYPAPGPVDYVLEVNGGFSDKNNIKTGQMLSGLEQL